MYVGAGVCTSVKVGLSDIRVHHGDMQQSDSFLSNQTQTHTDTRTHNIHSVTQPDEDEDERQQEQRHQCEQQQIERTNHTRASNKRPSRRDYHRRSRSDVLLFVIVAVLQPQTQRSTSVNVVKSCESSQTQ